MSALFVAEALIVIAAFFGMRWLRREGDRLWAVEVRRRGMARQFVRIQIAVADRLTPALRQMAVEIAKLSPAMARLGEAVRKAGVQPPPPPQAPARPRRC